MNNKVLAIFSVLLTFVMIFASVLLIDAYLNDTDDIQLLIISLVFSLASLVVFFVVIFDLFIGRKDLTFENDKIIVSKKGKIVNSISKSDISNAVLTYDSYNKALCILSFAYNKRKYYLSVTKANKRTIELFFNDVKCSKRNSTLEYFIQYIIEVFS